MPTPIPAGRAASRHRLPVEPPIRELLIASLASVAGACQLFAWALARLPTFFVVFGIVLVATGLGFGVAAVVRHSRLRWIAHVGPDSLTVVNGQRRTVLAWADVRAVRYADSRVQLTGDGGERLCTLAVDRTRPAHEAAQVLERAIVTHLPSSA